MHLKQWTILTGLLTALLALLPVSQAAEGDWSVRTDVQGLYGNYSGSLMRSSISSGGAILSADYLERGGFAVGGNYTNLRFKTSSNINQQAVYGSVHYNVYMDALPGSLTLRLDGLGVFNDDITGNTDNVRVIAPQLSFLNYAKTFYVDFGYAYSIYKNNLKVHQFTPTLGFVLNNAADWFQFRGYIIDPSNPLRAQNKNSTAAVDIKWTHWFEPGAWHHLEKMQLGGLIGERIYAVDGDAALVYNLADIQRGSGSLALQWRLSESLHLMLMGGDERYLNNLTADTYDNRFIYLNISKQW